MENFRTLVISFILLLYGVLILAESNDGVTYPIVEMPDVSKSFPTYEPRGSEEPVESGNMSMIRNDHVVLPEDGDGLQYKPELLESDTKIPSKHQTEDTHSHTETPNSNEPLPSKADPPPSGKFWDEDLYYYYHQNARDLHPGTKFFWRPSFGTRTMGEDDRHPSLYGRKSIDLTKSDDSSNGVCMNNYSAGVAFLNLFNPPYCEEEDLVNLSKAERRLRANWKKRSYQFPVPKVMNSFCYDDDFPYGSMSPSCPFMNFTADQFTVKRMTENPNVPANFFSKMKGLKDEYGYFSNTSTMNDLAVCLYTDVHDRVFTTIHRVPVLHELWTNHWTVPCFFIGIAIFMHYRSYELSEIQKSKHKKTPWWPEVIFLRHVRKWRQWINNRGFVGTILVKLVLRVTLPIVFFIFGNLVQAFVVQMAISYAKPDAPVLEAYKQLSAAVYSPEKFASHLMALVVAESVYSLRVYYDRRWFCIVMAIVYFIVRRFVRNLCKFYNTVTVMTTYLVIAVIYSVGGPFEIFSISRTLFMLSVKKLVGSTAKHSKYENFLLQQLNLMKQNYMFIAMFVAVLLWMAYYVIGELKFHYLADDYSIADDFQMPAIPGSYSAVRNALWKLMRYAWGYLEDDFKTSGFVVNKWPSVLSSTGWDPSTVAAASNSSFLLFIEAGDIVGNNWRNCLNESNNVFIGSKANRYLFTDLMYAEDRKIVEGHTLLYYVNTVDLWVANFLYYYIHSIEAIHVIFRLSFLIPAVYLGLFYKMFVSKWNASHVKKTVVPKKRDHVSGTTSAKELALQPRQSISSELPKSVMSNFEESDEVQPTRLEMLPSVTVDKESGKKLSVTLSTRPGQHFQPSSKTKYLKSSQKRPVSHFSLAHIKRTSKRFIRAHLHYFSPLCVTLGLFIFQHLMIQQLIYYQPKATKEESVLYLYSKIVPFDHILISMVVFQLANTFDDMKPAKLTFRLSLMWYFCVYFIRRLGKNSILLLLDHTCGNSFMKRNVVAFVVAIIVSFLHAYRKEVLAMRPIYEERLKSLEKNLDSRPFSSSRKVVVPFYLKLYRVIEFFRRKIISYGEFFDKPHTGMLQLCIWEGIFYSWLFIMIRNRKWILSYMKYDFRHDLITTVVSWGSLFAVVDMQMIFPVFAMLAESLNMINLQLGTNIMNDFEEIVSF